MAGCLDGILRVSRSLCRGGLRNPLVREVCVGLSRGEVGGGRGGVVVRDWGGRGVPGSVGGGRVVGLSVVAGRLLSVVARTWVVVALSPRSLSSVATSHWSLSPKALCVVLTVRHIPESGS